MTNKIIFYFIFLSYFLVGCKSYVVYTPTNKEKSPILILNSNEYELYFPYGHSFWYSNGNVKHRYNSYMFLEPNFNFNDDIHLEIRRFKTDSCKPSLRIFNLQQGMLVRGFKKNSLEALFEVKAKSENEQILLPDSLVNDSIYIKFGHKKSRTFRVDSSVMEIYPVLPHSPKGTYYEFLDGIENKYFVVNLINMKEVILRMEGYQNRDIWKLKKRKMTRRRYQQLHNDFK